MALTTKDKKELALSLFLTTDKSQKEIAARVEVSENTLSAWVAEGKWKMLKGAKTATRREVIADLFNQLALIKESAKDASGKARPMTPAESQSVRMISKSISELDKKLGLDNYISMAEEMMTWLYEVNPTAAKQLMPYVDGFIDYKIGQFD